MNFNPIQTNAMPLNAKIMNMLWGAVNCTLFRFTPPHFFGCLRFIEFF